MSIVLLAQRERNYTHTLVYNNRWKGQVLTKGKQTHQLSIIDHALATESKKKTDILEKERVSLPTPDPRQRFPGGIKNINTREA